MGDYVLLIIVLAVLLFGAVKGYRRGFLRLAVWFAGLIAVLFIVTKISPYVSDFLIKNTSLYDNVRQRIIVAYEEKNANDIPDDSFRGDERENRVIDSFGFPDLITNSIKSNNTSEIYDRLAVTLFKDYISGYLSALSIKAGTFVGLFVILAIIQCVLFLAIKILEKIPVLRTFNRLLGMATGITLALVLVWVFFIAVMMFFGRSFGAWVFSQVKASRILTYLFNNNILFELVK
ncbi:MAG: CvpA family protein [Lachnospiraceae bacterium]|nr:CvpA family protein [Lachnospiraceae bacterium]